MTTQLICSEQADVSSTQMVFLQMDFPITQAVWLKNDTVPISSEQPLVFKDIIRSQISDMYALYNWPI